MKFPFIRRAAALALALVMALTLPLSLAPPAWAADSEQTGSTEPAQTPGEPGEGEGDGGDNDDDDGGDPETPEVSFQFASPGDETRDSGSWTIVTYLTNPPEGADAEITWEVGRAPGKEGTKLPTFSGTNAANEPVTGSKITVTDTTISVTSHGAGDFVVSATYDGRTITKNVTISGIVLSGPRLKIDEETGAYGSGIEMFVSGSTTLTATPYGAADDRGATRVEWISSDSSVVSVMNNGGNLYAWGLGTAVITATKGSYSADCTVNVVEDASVIASGFYAAASEPLKFWDEDPNYPGRDTVGLYTQLNNICLRKTEDFEEYSYYDEETATGIGYGLDYITNLKVSTDQGTLYYNYSTESDTGDGVGYTDQFALTAGGAKLTLGRLYFVPKQGFSGTAEITFSAIAANRRNISGVIKVEVGAGSAGGAYDISYRALAGEPVWFSASDFDAWCRSVNGRSYNYITFNMPRASDGALYYNYTVKGSGNPVTTGIRFSPSGEYTIDDVCFVPSAALENNSKVTISFRAVDTSGTAFDGTVTVNVTAVDTGEDPSNVTVTGKRGQPVTLQSSMFLDACQGTIRDTLSFVTFQLPDPDVGTLYVNYQSENVYESRVTAGTRCYYSGVPGLDSVSFVPASGAPDRIAVSYTGYGSGGASYSGTLYIVFEEADRSVIYYSVAKGGSVAFNALDFYNAALYRKGVGVSCVTFDLSKILRAPNADLGTLYYNYQGTGYYNQQVISGAYYYYNPGYSWYQWLSLISFRAGNTAGTITIPYKAYDSNYNLLFDDGKVVIQVGSVRPEDVRLSCRVSEEAQLTVSAIYNVCGAVMNKGLSYIEITGVPAAEKGYLYYDHNGVGTGTAVTRGDRFYCIGSPNIGRLKFLPGSSGEAEITYIGYSYDGQEQVSGRILVNVTRSTASRYFTDMDRYTWAIDSVDYLYRTRTAAGRGDGRFDPGGTVTRGDFTLMLVKGCGLTAAGSVSFGDVSADKYYADAIRVASLLGIVSGVGNGNFDPEAPLTRQDAMVMLYKTLKISGKTATNGLAADFSAYRDEKEIAPYAREAMGSLMQMGIVEGDGNGYLSPKRQLNRAEAAVLLHKIMTL